MSGNPPSPSGNPTSGKPVLASIEVPVSRTPASKGGGTNVSVGGGDVSWGGGGDVSKVDGFVSNVATPLSIMGGRLSSSPHATSAIAQTAKLKLLI